MQDHVSNEEKVFEYLDALGIRYTVHHHKAVFTVDEVVESGNLMPGMNVKNLVIKDKKKGKHYLVILDDFRRLDFKHFAGITGWSSKARFADEEDLIRYLGLTRGSCSIFGLINDMDDHVIVVLGKEICKADPGQMINFHPNINTATVSLKIKDMFRFLESCGNQYIMEE